MEPQPFSIELAGVPLTIRPCCTGTAECFGYFCEPPRADAPVLAVEPQSITRARTVCPPDATDGALEYNLLVAKAADALLPFERYLFHGVAFLWHGKSYIFTAPSGTGKTTQYLLWRRLYGDEVRMLNGDKPILAYGENGELWVHSSPWMGKESLGRRASAPLGGIVYLSQAKENTIARLPIREAVLPLFCQFLFSANLENEVHQVCAIEETILRTVPVWHLANRGDEASARLGHDTLLQFEEGCV